MEHVEQKKHVICRKYASIFFFIILHLMCLHSHLQLQYYWCLIHVSIRCIDYIYILMCSPSEGGRRCVAKLSCPLIPIHPDLIPYDRSFFLCACVSLSCPRVTLFDLTQSVLFTSVSSSERTSVNRTPPHLPRPLTVI